ncbi:MAG: metallophosphatase family protein [Proteobacteria bacterium]|nr:metallophosphatase family protein [Pseudomonadota bacterium]
MRIAILSDIHGNLEALNSIFDVLDQIRPDTIISLGDNVGYGPDPEKVMQILRRRNIPSILGNHELAVKRESFINWFNPVSKMAVHHTLANLSRESVNQINHYPRFLVFENMRFVHGAPLAAVAIYIYQISDDKLAGNFQKMAENVAFIGHTHDLGLIEYDGERVLHNTLSKGQVILNKNRKYIVNAGSVGQPRDGDNSAKFVMFNTETYQLDVRYVPYDYQRTAEKIKNEGLPDQFADKLYPIKKDR